MKFAINDYISHMKFFVLLCAYADSISEEMRVWLQGLCSILHGQHIHHMQLLNSTWIKQKQLHYKKNELK